MTHSFVSRYSPALIRRRGPSQLESPVNQQAVHVGCTVLFSIKIELLAHSQSPMVSETPIVEFPHCIQREASRDGTESIGHSVQVSVLQGAGHVESQEELSRLVQIEPLLYRHRDIDERLHLTRETRALTELSIQMTYEQVQAAISALLDWLSGACAAIDPLARRRRRQGRKLPATDQQRVQDCGRAESSNACVAAQDGLVEVLAACITCHGAGDIGAPRVVVKQRRWEDDLRFCEAETSDG